MQFKESPAFNLLVEWVEDETQSAREQSCSIPSDLGAFLGREQAFGKMIQFPLLLQWFDDTEKDLLNMITNKD